MIIVRDVRDHVCGAETDIFLAQLTLIKPGCLFFIISSSPYSCSCFECLVTKLMEDSFLNPEHQIPFEEQQRGLPKTAILTELRIQSLFKPFQVAMLPYESSGLILFQGICPESINKVLLYIRCL